eukprot:scaffold3587_cov364-Prasinococcus_capsulatus_cf.AAC.7
MAGCLTGIEWRCRWLTLRMGELTGLLESYTDLERRYTGTSGEKMLDSSEQMKRRRRRRRRVLRPVDGGDTPGAGPDTPTDKNLTSSSKDKAFENSSHPMVTRWMKKRKRRRRVRTNQALIDKLSTPGGATGSVVAGSSTPHQVMKTGAKGAATPTSKPEASPQAKGPDATEQVVKILDALTSSSDSDGPTVRFYSDLSALEERVELLMYQLKFGGLADGGMLQSRKEGEAPPQVEPPRNQGKKEESGAKSIKPKSGTTSKTPATPAAQAASPAAS